MDKAKAKVSEFMHRSGEKDTTVHETVAPAVTKETVVPTRHDETQYAIDKEVHQDHYHTSIQPVQEAQVLPEQHVHQVAGVEERSFQHGSPEDDKARAAAALQGVKDERYVADTRHTASEAAATTGQHVHHHIHETIQPVIQKETTQPEVVHTTKPIHEVHQNAAIHHGTHELPPVSRQELESKGIGLGGREERYDHFQGEPKTIGGVPTSSGTSTSAATTAAQTAAARSGTDSYASAGNPITGTGSSATAGTTSGTTGTTDSATKPSLMDKINPKVDATGDGNPGFMK